jgi:23S rRNA pseudouridine2605 synthase
VRLNRYLSLCGLGSRRGVEAVVLEGRVSINGHFVKDLATQVEDDDRVLVDGRPIRLEKSVVIALNKPKGYVCTRSDEHDRLTIYDLLPRQFQTLHHVGRLDKDSAGLLLLTNRGDLSHRLIHPSQGAEKEYEVVTDQPMDQETMAKMVKGMMTEEGYAKAERAWLVTEYRAHVVLKQGLKRQIRLMFYQLGFEVERLTRVRIGWLELRGLPRGSWKELSQAEIERFFSKEGATGRAPDAAPPRPRLRKKPVGKPTDSERRARPAGKKSASRTAKPGRRPAVAAPRSGKAMESERRERSMAGQKSASRTAKPGRRSAGAATRSGKSAESGRRQRPMGDEKSLSRADQPGRRLAAGSPRAEKRTASRSAKAAKSPRFGAKSSKNRG